MSHRERINYNIVIAMIGISLLVYMVGAIVLALYDKTLPQELSYVAVGLGGALAGAFLPDPTAKAPPSAPRSASSTKTK